MPEGWVINASPLILFGRIGRLDLCEALPASIVVPESVIDEVRVGLSKDVTASLAIQWAERYSQAPIAVCPSVVPWDLGAGETQVISLCLRSGKRAIMDDRMARRCANAHGIAVTGSLGVIMRAKKHGLIGEARPWVEKLTEAGLFVTQHVTEVALAGVGEGH